jgi:hypothetical protein
MDTIDEIFQIKTSTHTRSRCFHHIPYCQCDNNSEDNCPENASAYNTGELHPIETCRCGRCLNCSHNSSDNQQYDDDDGGHLKLKNTKLFTSTRVAPAEEDNNERQTAQRECWRHFIDSRHRSLS